MINPPRAQIKITRPLNENYDHPPQPFMSTDDSNRISSIDHLKWSSLPTSLKRFHRPRNLVSCRSPSSHPTPASLHTPTQHSSSLFLSTDIFALFRLGLRNTPYFDILDKTYLKRWQQQTICNGLSRTFVHPVLVLDARCPANFRPRSSTLALWAR